MNEIPQTFGALPATVHWLDEAGGLSTAAANTSLLSRELYLAAPIRTGNRYKHQRNYHGRYFFSQTRRHVWTESLLEASALAWLDMHEDIVAISSQPMKIAFADGFTHVPDFIALHSDMRQVMYDVKPERFQSEKALAQFAKTRTVCAEVGWGYEVLGTLAPQVQANLDWFVTFKNRYYYPGDEAVARLLDALGPDTTVLEAARWLGLPQLPAARSALFHLVWIGIVSIDLTNALSDSTIIERNARAHA